MIKIKAYKFLKTKKQSPYHRILESIPAKHPNNSTN